MRAVLYSRVSTEEQVVSGLGLTAQHDRMRTAASARGWTITAELSDEGISGKIAPAKRPGLAAAVDLLCDGKADVLVVAKLDRLTRTTRHLLEVLDTAERCKFGVVALDSDVDTTTVAGRLVATMMGGVAEWERRVIGERTKAALAVKKAQGARLGGPVTTPEPIRARVAELHAQGVSLSKIAAAINSEGHRTQAGTRWSKSGVQRLVGSLRLDLAATTARAASVPHNDNNQRNGVTPCSARLGAVNGEAATIAQRANEPKPGDAGKVRPSRTLTESEANVSKSSP